MNREPTADALGLHERASATPASAQPSDEGVGELGCAPSWTMGELSLRAQQTWFAAIISTPESEAAPVDAHSAARLIAPSPTQAPLERLAIYRRGYHARLIECLVDDYPVLQYALGEAAFEDLCRAYIARHPSSSPSLNYFGRRVAEFCRGYSLPAPGFAADLAELEWAIVLAIHARGASTIGLPDLSRVPSDRFPSARFELNPTLSLLELEYPANAFLQAYRRGQSPTIPGPARTRVAVYRTGRSVWRLELEPALLTLVRSLAAGSTLETALGEVQALLVGPKVVGAEADAEKAEAEAARLVAFCFQQGVSSGLFSKLLLESGD